MFLLKFDGVLDEFRHEDEAKPKEIEWGTIYTAGHGWETVEVFSTNVVENIVERIACRNKINDEHYYYEIIQPENPPAVLLMYISKIAHGKVNTPSDVFAYKLNQVAKGFTIIVISCSSTHGLDVVNNRIGYIAKEEQQ